MSLFIEGKVTLFCRVDFHTWQIFVAALGQATSNQETLLVSSQHGTRSPGVLGRGDAVPHRHPTYLVSKCVRSPKNPTFLSASIWMFRV